MFGCSQLVSILTLAEIYLQKIADLQISKMNVKTENNWSYLHSSLLLSEHTIVPTVTVQVLCTKEHNCLGYTKDPERVRTTQPQSGSLGYTHYRFVRNTFLRNN